MITFEAANEQARKQGYYVSWLCVDSADKWQCALRRRDNQPFMHTSARDRYTRRGRGDSAATAITAALGDEYADVLG